MANGMLGFLSRLLPSKLQPSCCAMEIEVDPDERKVETGAAAGEQAPITADDKAAATAEQRGA